MYVLARSDAMSIHESFRTWESNALPVVSFVMRSLMLYAYAVV